MRVEKEKRARYVEVHNTRKANWVSLLSLCLWATRLAICCLTISFAPLFILNTILYKIISFPFALATTSHVSFLSMDYGSSIFPLLHALCWLDPIDIFEGAVWICGYYRTVHSSSSGASRFLHIPGSRPSEWHPQKLLMRIWNVIRFFFDMQGTMHSTSGRQACVIHIR